MRNLTGRLPAPPPKNIVHLVQQRPTESLSRYSWPCWRIWATERGWNFTSQTERELPRSAGCGSRFRIWNFRPVCRSVLSPQHSVLSSLLSVVSCQLSVVYRSTNNPPGSFTTLIAFPTLPPPEALTYSSTPLRSKKPLMLLSEAWPKPLETK